ncbi:MAG: sulfatase, partial [Leptospiraceae bacterium]|nr:sulfatase [Leptospiraceae bacterium]
MDSLRADVVGFNGASYGATPSLDSLAQTSFVFKKHLVNSAWTRPSTYSFLTGKYPSKTYINLWDYAVFPSEKKAFYESNLFPLPALLSMFGYRTIMIGNNPFMSDHHQIGVDLGFEEIYDFSFLTEDTPKITQKVFELFKEIQVESRPVFLFINYNDPHKPYEPLPQFLSRIKGTMDERKRRYLGELAQVDEEVGKLLTLLKQENFLDRSFTLVTSDHGEVMSLSHAVSKFTGVYTYFGHGQGLYEEDVHVPLLLRIPYQNFHKKIDQLTQGIDLVPTILELLNIPFKEKDFDGRSIVPMLKDVYMPEKVYYGETRGVKGVRLGGWKLMKKTYEFHRLG